MKIIGSEDLEAVMTCRRISWRLSEVERHFPSSGKSRRPPADFIPVGKILQLAASGGRFQQGPCRRQFGGGKSQKGRLPLELFRMMQKPGNVPDTVIIHERSHHTPEFGGNFSSGRPSFLGKVDQHSGQFFVPSAV